MMKKWAAALALLLLLLPFGACAAEPGNQVTVFAAASLTNVLQELGGEYTKARGTKVVFSFAATSILARQVESGAQADVFFSADQEWMDYLDQRGLIRKGTRQNLLGNRLALVAPANSTITLHIEPNFPLLAALHGGRLATGDPDSVPVGKYARSALTTLGIWNDIADRLVRADNVRTALAFVARGEAPLGIVYVTDAKLEPGVRVVDVFPANTHRAISYPVGVIGGANERAAAFIDYLRGPAGTAAFEKCGFIVLH
jgi:molybdate transport system substrate-binding protein